MEEWEHVDLDTNEFNLIDFSSENDNLYFSVSPISSHHHFQECQGDSAVFETVGDMDLRNESQGNDQFEPVPELPQSEEPQRIRSGKYNFRKSLAWDKAFFTSAGVLDPEELTCMMDGRKAVKKQFLPGIQEDMQRSTDSISTLESDNFTLESLEVELFADIRASIQKSSTTAKRSLGKKAIQKDGDQDISAPNGDSVSQNQLKSKPVIKKVVGVHKLGVRECQPKVNTVIKGSKKAVKTESGRSVVPRSAVTIGESASSLAKAPKGSSKSSSATSSGTKVTSLGPSRLKIENGNNKTVSPRVTSLSKSSSTTSSGTKGISLGPSRLKTENGNAKTVARRGTHESTKSSYNGPCKILPMSGSTSKSSSRKTTMAETQIRRSSSKGASCDSPLSESEVKPPSATVRRKAPSKVVNSLSPRATPQSSKIASKVPSCISPASSVSEWSSTSSSSTVNQKSNKSRSSFGSRSENGDGLLFNRKARSNNQTTRGQNIKRSAESVKKTDLPAGAISGSSSTKLTGLRMPSPKFGYFDGIKSVHASSGAMQSHPALAVSLSKIGAGVSPRGISNIKHKICKLPPGTVVTATKHETQNSDASLPTQGNKQVSPHNGEHKKMVETPVKVQGHGSEEHDVVSAKENLGAAKNEMMLDDPALNESKTNEISPKKNIDVSRDKMMLEESEYNESKTDSCSLSIIEKLDDFKIEDHYDLGSILNSCCEIGEKENATHKDRIDQSNKDEGGVKSETVDLQTIEALQVTCSEVS